MSEDGELVEGRLVDIANIYVRDGKVRPLSVEFEYIEGKITGVKLTVDHTEVYDAGRRR